MEGFFVVWACEREQLIWYGGDQEWVYNKQDACVMPLSLASEVAHQNDAHVMAAPWPWPGHTEAECCLEEAETDICVLN